MEEMNELDVENLFLFDYSIGKDKLINKLSDALDYLWNNIKIPSKIFQDVNGYFAMIFIGKSLAFRADDLKEYMNLFLKKKFYVILGDLLYYLSDIKNEISFNKMFHLYNAEELNDLNEKRIVTLQYSLYINNILLLLSSAFSSKISLHNGLKAYFSFINDTEFVKKNQLAKIKMWSKEILLIEYLVMNISSLSKMVDENKIIWKELDTVNSLIIIVNMVESTKLDAYIAIANIADDKQLESLNEISFVVDMIISQLKQCQNDFSLNNFKRDSRQAIIENDTIDCCIYCVKQNNGTTTSIIVLLNGLYKILVNDKMKNDIYFKYKLKECLKVILSLGNCFEAYFTLRLFAQLSFSERIANDLVDDKEFMSILEGLSKQNIKDENENERKVCTNIEKLREDIKWNLNKNQIQNTHSNQTNQNKHIMISYNTNSRDLCLKIKENLEASGYRVWIDVNDIHGSSLEAMANAVENSFCVLICVTEKYRQSVNCQAEAQYAFKLNKKIIPLIMQQGYESVQGWLGIIMGDKIFINFTKYEYDECFRRLKNEIDSYLNTKPIVNVNATLNNIASSAQPVKVSKINSSTNNDIENWNEAKVKEWFIANKLSLNIYESLNPCNGQIIKQLFEMKCTASEFYYQSINKIESNFRSVTLFTFFLNKLFDS